MTTFSQEENDYMDLRATLGPSLLAGLGDVSLTEVATCLVSPVSLAPCSWLLAPGSWLLAPGSLSRWWWRGLGTWRS